MSICKERNVNFKLLDVSLIGANDEQLVKISSDLGISLNLEEMKFIQNHFFTLKRNPTDIELNTIGQTWSEHCFHKTFKAKILNKKGKILVENLLKKYIIKATTKLNKKWCLSVFEDNAGIVDFENGYAIAIKVETHNHPSAIEPFGGAATGVGGVIRDILGVWANPIACTDVLCFGPLDYKYNKLGFGIKHPRYIYKGVIAGIGSYANNMGIPTINGAILFDESYTGNPLVFCGCIGIIPFERFIRDTKPGDLAILVGGRTGRDGIHGGIFASIELSKDSEVISRPAVQIPNPIEEEKLKRGIERVRDLKLGSGITDLGAGGLSSAIGEVAKRSSCGIEIELDRVKLKYERMAPWEIWVSESQERMLITSREEFVHKITNIFTDEGVEAITLGRFDKSQMLKINYQGVRIADLSLNFLFNPPKAVFISESIKTDLLEPNFQTPNNLNEILLELMSSPNIASKESIIRTYDHEVQGITVLKPLQGKYSGPNDATVLKPLKNSWKGIVVSCGIKPEYGKLDPYWMTASSIDEAIRNNICVGGRRIALLDNFCWGSPKKPELLNGLIRATKACHDFSIFFETPFVSGKDSLYNESQLGSVVSTILITALGIIPDIRRVTSLVLKKSDDLIYILGLTLPELGGSEYYKLMGFLGKNVPKVNSKIMKRTINAIIGAIDNGYIKACHDISEGGLAVAAAEMVLSSEYGMEIFLDKVPKVNLNRNDLLLFSESNSRLLIEIPQDCKDKFEEKIVDIPHGIIGKVKKEKKLTIFGLDGKNIIDLNSKYLRENWKKTFGG